MTTFVEIVQSLKLQALENPGQPCYRPMILNGQFLVFTLVRQSNDWQLSITCQGKPVSEQEEAKYVQAFRIPFQSEATYITRVRWTEANPSIHLTELPTILVTHENSQCEQETADEMEK